MASHLRLSHHSGLNGGACTLRSSSRNMGRNQSIRAACIACFLMILAVVLDMPLERASKNGGWKGGSKFRPVELLAALIHLDPFAFSHSHAHMPIIRTCHRRVRKEVFLV
jgi:hypothetical protein